jgi:probable HAF family extracellular repeat protein
MLRFFWNGKKLKDLGTFGGSNGAANSLNDADEVVGVADFPGDQLHDAFLWKKGKMIDLGNLGLTSAAYSINSQTQIVGASRVNSTTVHAFLWERGEIVDLNHLVSPKSDVQLQGPSAIADNGEIAVNGLPKGCSNGDICGHPYVLIPDGNCDGDCEARIAASHNNVAAASETLKRGTETLATRGNRLRDRLSGRYRLPGQPSVPSY